MAIIDTAAPTITPPPVKYDHAIILAFNSGLSLAGVKSAYFGALMAPANADGTFSHATPPTVTEQSMADVMAMAQQFGATAASAAADAAAASSETQATLTAEIQQQAIAAGATDGGAAAVAAAAQQISQAGTDAANLILENGQLAGAAATAIVALDSAIQNAAAALLNFLKPPGFGEMAVQ